MSNSQLSSNGNTPAGPTRPELTPQNYGGQAVIEGVMMRGSRAVSYTHLDVYKRQV